MEDQRLSQTEAAARMGVSKARLSQWKRKGTLKPSLGSKPGRTKGRGMNTYTLRDVVAGTFVKVATEDLHLTGVALSDLARLVQEGDQVKLERAAILTVRTTPGFMRNILIGDLTLRPTGVAEFLELEKTDFTDGFDLLEYLRETGKYVSHATLYEGVEAILKQVAKKLEQDAMLATQNAAA